MNFTFKKEKSAPYSTMETVIIKLKKHEIGTIFYSQYKADDRNSIMFQVIKADINEDGNPNCKWKWITLKYNPTSLDDAKAFLNRNCDKLIERYNFLLE